MTLGFVQGKSQDPKGARGAPPLHLPGLDGLRALAVLAVLLYHSDLGWMPAGFLGVEVFFVISGYLITWLLLSEWHQVGRIDLKRFWQRRARRLLPALFAMVAATLSFAIVFQPEQVAGLRGDVLAALGYVTNWYLILVQKSYFEAMGRPSLLQHLWSLAVEEQFYLLWPLVLALLLRRWHPRRVWLGVLAGAVVSALLMAVLYRPDMDPSRIYYGTDTRAAGLLIGAALAFIWQPGQRTACVQTHASFAENRLQPIEEPPAKAGARSDEARVRIRRRKWLDFGKRWDDFVPLVLDALGLVGLGILLWAAVSFDQFEAGLYLWGLSLVAVSTACVIAVATHPRAHVGSLLDREPLRWIGVRSYGIYLWYWPVFDLTRPQLDVPFSGLPLFVVRLAVTIALAELSFRFVETPARQGALGRAWATMAHARGYQQAQVQWRLVGAVAGILLFSIALGASVVSAQPSPPPAYSSETLATASGSLQGVAAATPTAIPTAPATIALAPPTLPATIAAPATRIAPSPTRAGPAAPAVALVPSGANQVTAIGDSVMLGAAQDLVRDIRNVDVDAEVGRQVSQTIDLLKARRATNRLGDVVVIHVGNNGPFSARQLNELMGVLAAVSRVVIVNDSVPRAWQGPNNAMLAAGVKQYPNVVLVDWRGASADRPEYFWKDGIHLRPAGARAYVGLIAAAINAR